MLVYTVHIYIYIYIYICIYIYTGQDMLNSIIFTVLLHRMPFGQHSVYTMNEHAGSEGVALRTYIDIYTYIYTQLMVGITFINHFT